MNLRVCAFPAVLGLSFCIYSIEEAIAETLDGAADPVVLYDINANSGDHKQLHEEGTGRIAIIMNQEQQMAWEALRRGMVERQIRSRGIRDSGVLRAMETVPRHEFVPGEEIPRAYEDTPLSIGLGQTISQPYIVAFMTELLRVDVEHKVLEVGTGSGYQTAILATLAREVYTVDIHEPLVHAAETRLRALGFENVQFAVRNGHLGWPEAAPFDRILVTAGPVSIPQPLVDQLVIGGRMVIPVGAAAGDQVLKLVVKSDAFHVDIRDTVPVRFVPLIYNPEES